MRGFAVRIALSKINHISMAATHAQGPFRVNRFTFAMSEIISAYPPIATKSRTSGTSASAPAYANDRNLKFNCGLSSS